MVSKELIMGTIKKMFSSGVDDETVRNTLKDIGLSDSEISAYISEAKGGRPVQEVQSKGMQEKVMQKSQEEVQREEDAGESEEESPEVESSSEEGGYGDEDSEEGDSESGLEDRLRDEVQGVRDVHELGHSATHMALEDHSEMLDDIQKKIDVLYAKIDSSPSISPETIKKINSLDAKITSIEKELLEVKALSNALQDILKKVLDTDREVLNRLEKK